VVLAPCGYGIEETRTRALADGVLDELADTPAGRVGAITAVDANAYFSRPGPRVVDGILILVPLLYAGRAEISPTLDDAAFRAAFPPDGGAWTIGRRAQSPQ
jgi:iron complex transport system substrate-binding protein